MELFNCLGKLPSSYIKKKNRKIVVLPSYYKCPVSYLKPFCLKQKWKENRIAKGIGLHMSTFSSCW